MLDKLWVKKGCVETTGPGSRTQGSLPCLGFMGTWRKSFSKVEITGGEKERNHREFSPLGRKI